MQIKFVSGRDLGEVESTINMLLRDGWERDSGLQYYETANLFLMSMVRWERRAIFDEPPLRMSGSGRAPTAMPQELEMQMAQLQEAVSESTTQGECSVDYATARIVD